MPWFCCTCTKRTTWCRWCRVRHCACRPHVSRKRKYWYKVVLIRKLNGQTSTMAARRYAHLKGAQKGGQKTALGPNPGRFDSEAARKASLARWLGSQKANRWSGVRPGRILKRTRPEVSRAHLRVLYARAPRLGIRYLPITKQWVQGSAVIAERTALRRLGHLPHARKNWVPGEHEVIVATSTGTDPAWRKARKTP